MDGGLTTFNACLGENFLMIGTKIVNHQDTQSGERFVAVRVDQLGVDELNVDLPQIEDIVKPFLPDSCKYLYAINATREIVNGFKYEITFVMSNENDVEVYCAMDVLEKPWLVKNSKKFRKMTYNNCSLANPSDDEDRMRFQYDINPTFVNQRVEINQQELFDMEDQIVTSKPRKTTTTASTTTETSAEDDDENVSLAPLDPSSKNLLDDFFNMNNYFPPPQTTTTTTASPNLNMDGLDEMFGIRKVSNSQTQPKISDDSSSSEDDNLQQKRVEVVDKEPSRNETALKDLEVEIKKVFSELFQTDPTFQANIIALINRKDDLTAQKNYNAVINILARKLKDKIENVRNLEESEGEQQVTIDPLNDRGDIRKKRSSNMKIWDLAEDALATLDRFDTDDKKRILMKILNVRDVNGQKSFQIIAKIANSHCQENSHEIGNCDEKIDENSIKICKLEVKNWKCSKLIQINALQETAAN